MTLLQLEYFLALSRNLHYTKTAEQLCISQPSLSYAIIELEKELGAKLFKKEGKKMALTIYGQQFLPYVEKSLSFLSDGTNTLRRMTSAESRVVRIGYFQSISASVIPLIIGGFRKQETADNIVFQFTESSSHETLNQIHAGSLDLGFSFHQADWAESIPVSHQSLYLAVPVDHALAARDKVTFLDFALEPQIMLGHSSSLRMNMDHVFAEHEIIPNIAFVVRECNAALQYVGMGFGVSVMPLIPAMNPDKVVFLPIYIDGKAFARTVYFTYLKARRLTACAQTVRDYIVENFTLAD